MSVTTQTLSDDAPELSEEAEPTDLPKDKIFHILQTQRRRDALRYLKEHGCAVTMRDLAEQVAAWENDTTVHALASDERQRVYIALYQSHLPKLDQENIIEYNQSRGIVERGPLAEQFDPYLDTPSVATTDAADEDADDDADRWFDYYRAATAVSTVLFAAVWLNLLSVASSVVGTVVVCLYAVISAAQYVSS